jgi:hypothetical protein
LGHWYRRRQRRCYSWRYLQSIAQGRSSLDTDSGSQMETISQVPALLSGKTSAAKIVAVGVVEFQLEIHARQSSECTRADCICQAVQIGLTGI